MIHLLGEGLRLQWIGHCHRVRHFSYSGLDTWAFFMTIKQPSIRFPNDLSQGTHVSTSAL